MKSLDPFKISFSGVHLIEASAGTGKTYSIASLYISAIIEANKTVDEILVVTYTEAATKELRDRLISRLREARQALQGKTVTGDSFLAALKKQVSNKEQAIKKLQKAIHSFDEAAVYTIHGFCRHALQEHAFKSGASFEVELIGDDTEIAEEVIVDYWRNWVHKASQNSLQKPILKLLLDKGYDPAKLIDELAPHIGKPYYEIRPQAMPEKNLEKELYEFAALFDELKSCWSKQKEAIYNLLRSEQINGNKYKKNDLAGWMHQMTELLHEQVPSVEPFERFNKFAQSTINQSLKKSTTKPAPTHVFFEKVDRYQAIAAGLKQFEVTFKQHLFSELLMRLQQRKQELQVYSYDDLLIDLKNALYDSEQGASLRHHLQRTYPVALVDEFQDTDPVQYQIFKAIYGEEEATALFMIGDPKQSIYSFRGADIFAYLQAKEDAPPQKSYDLVQNFRSVAPLLAGINDLFASHDNPFIIKDIAYRRVLPGKNITDRLTFLGEEVVPFEIRNLTVAQEEAVSKEKAKNCSAQDTAAEIYHLLAAASDGDALIGNERVRARDMAVLVRSHRQASLISDALRKRGIKSVRHSRDSVFKTGEARELYTLLKAVINPTDERYVVAALSTDILGYGGDTVFELRQQDAQWAAKLNQFARWQERWQDDGFAFMFSHLMQEEHVAETVMKRADGERMLTNLIHLAELLQQQERDEKAGPHSLLTWLLKRCREDTKEREEEQMRLESDENLVRVVTMHHSKGLEYPIVFCPFLWHAPRRTDYGKPITYHDKNDNSKVYLDFGGKDDTDRDEKRYMQAEEALAEGVRLAYVAITRAKYKCYISWANAYKSAHSPLGFLLLGENESFKSLRSEIISGSKYEGVDASRIDDSLTKFEGFPQISVTGASDEEEAGEDIILHPGKFELQARKFGRTAPLAKGPGMSSFSSLVRLEHADFEPDYRPYYDNFLTEEAEDERALEQPPSVFSFPKGPGPGTAVHHMFENINFADAEAWDEVISRQLQAQNIGAQWVSVAHSMLRRSINKALLPDTPDLKLAAIKPKEMMQEMEFYLSTAAVELKDLLHIIRPGEDVPASIASFAGQGFLKGFIDLTFKLGDRYYILDYKTNHLGNAVQEYRSSQLKAEIKEKLYDLQYHLYLLALHRFLQKEHADYCYKHHMGGAFYLFVRGINSAGNEGIYFDRPKTETIMQLDKYLKTRDES